MPSPVPVSSSQLNQTAEVRAAAALVEEDSNDSMELAPSPPNEPTLPDTANPSTTAERIEVSSAGETAPNAEEPVEVAEETVTAPAVPGSSGTILGPSSSLPAPSKKQKKKKGANKKRKREAQTATKTVDAARAAEESENVDIGAD